MPCPSLSWRQASKDLLCCGATLADAIGQWWAPTISSCFRTGKFAAATNRRSFPQHPTGLLIYNETYIYICVCALCTVNMLKYTMYLCVILYYIYMFTVSIYMSFASMPYNCERTTLHLMKSVYLSLRLLLLVCSQTPTSDRWPWLFGRFLPQLHLVPWLAVSSMPLEGANFP